jgi:hypothetical protein
MEYHKIQSVFKRDMSTKKAEFIMWDWSLPEFEYLAASPWIGTEKIDGTNIRIYKDGRIGGRTANAQIPTFLLPVLEDVRSRLMDSELPDDTVLYGEGYGAKIQSGGHYIPNGNSFCLFDVNIAGNYQPRESVEDIAGKLGIAIAPVIGTETLIHWVELIRSAAPLESFTHRGLDIRSSILHPGARNEGVVLRPSVELRNRCGHRIITKLKFKDFM